MAPTAAPTTAFFCANLLLTKMRREWGRLPAEQRSELLSIVRCGAGPRALQEWRRRARGERARAAKASSTRPARRRPSPSTHAHTHAGPNFRRC
jgi:hypothetical protein